MTVYSMPGGKKHTPAAALGNLNRQSDRSLPSDGLTDNLQRLQSSAGNQAVAQLFKRLRANDTIAGLSAEHRESASLNKEPVIQRKLLYHKPGATFTPNTADEKELVPKIKEIDDIVETAYLEFINGDYTGASEAKIDLYKLRKHQYDNGEKSMHPSTAAGYVIEGKVNTALAGANGVQLQDHDILPNTIPDVTIEASSGNKALVDITASNSAGHILSKKGNWTNHVNIPVVAESLYPSIDFSNMMEQELSEEDLLKIQTRVAHDREMQELMEAQRQEAHKQQFLERQNWILELIEQQSTEKLNKWMNERKIGQLWKSGIIADEMSESGFSRVEYETWKGDLGVEFNEIEAVQACSTLMRELEKM